VSYRSFEEYVTLDGLALVTKGIAYEEWANSIPQSFITPTGLATFGFVIGLGDFWRYAEVIGNAHWKNVDL